MRGRAWLLHLQPQVLLHLRSYHVWNATRAFVCSLAPLPPPPPRPCVSPPAGTPARSSTPVCSLRRSVRPARCSPSNPPRPTALPPQVKLIDFGAACDLCTGINFNPEFGMLDPRYAGEPPPPL